jgi:hypothetical protein
MIIPAHQGVPISKGNFSEVGRLENLAFVFQVARKQAVTFKRDAISDEDRYKTWYNEENKAGTCASAYLILHAGPLVRLAEPPGLCGMSTWTVGREFRHSGIPP